MKLYKQTHGYTIITETKGAHSVITTPFADNFNLITHNKTMQQTLLTDIEKKIKSMGLKIKPKKCRLISIQTGKTVNTICKNKPDENQSYKILIHALQCILHAWLQSSTEHGWCSVGGSQRNETPMSYHH